MDRDRKIILFVASLLVFILFSLVFVYYYLSDRNKADSDSNNVVEVPIVEKQVDSRLLEQIVFKTATDNEIQPGVYEEDINEYGVKTAAIYGKLTNFFKSSEGYDAVLSTIVNGESVDLNIHFGGGRNPITNLISDRKNDFKIPTTFREGEEYLINEYYSKSTVKEVYDLYKSNLGVMFRIDIYQEIPDAPVNCDQICIEFYELFGRYKLANNQLVNDDNIVEVGAVYLVSRSY